MIIAKEKRKSNLAEYILYMWQVEDVIRAYNFDFEKLSSEYLSRFAGDESVRKEIGDWYQNLLVMMEKEGIQTVGHLQFLKNLLADMNEFHLKMLEPGMEPQYAAIYLEMNSLIAELREKMNQPEMPDVEVCMNGLYSFLILRMQKKEINSSTAVSFQRFGQLMGYLSARYLQFEKGDWEFGDGE